MDSTSNVAPKAAERPVSIPFDPRTEVSADARKIVLHMWIIFVLVPVVVGTIYALYTTRL